MAQQLCLTGADPIIFSPSFSLPKGMYSPNATIDNPLSMSYCPPTVECQLERLATNFCPPQGVFEPQLCPPGFYCPDYTTKILCPDGYICPRGSFEPKECSPLSSCNAGAASRTQLLGIVIVVVVDVLAIIIIAAFAVRRDARLRNAFGSTLRKIRLWIPTSSTSSPTEKKATVADESAVELGVAAPALATTDAANAVIDVLPSLQKEEDPVLDHANLDKLRAAFRRANEGNLAMHFSFTDLSLKLKDGRSILSGVTGSIRPGRVIAIMGPSGAGKTTFLSTLMGKVDRTGGNLQINGEKCEIHSFKQLIGYVPQDDVMHRELTVFENIYYSARIRLPTHWTDAQVKEHTVVIIEALGLSHVKDTLIGDELTRGISGGQRKRVSIGMELVAAPVAIMLDEPTSGLDSTSALQVCHILKTIAALGITVVAVVHQPRAEIFEQFDDLLLLQPGGRTAYLGSTEGVIPYFEGLGYKFNTRYNPADLLMDMLAGNLKPSDGQSHPDLSLRWESNRKQAGGGAAATGETAEDAIMDEVIDIKKSMASSVPNIELPSSNIMRKKANQRGAKFLHQVWLAHNRSIIQQYRKVASFGLEVFVSLLAGFLIGLSGEGLIVYQGVLLAPFTLLSPAPLEQVVPLIGLLLGMSVALSGAPAGVNVFSGAERVVYWREAGSGHNRLAYYLGKTFAAFYRFIVSAFHFAAIYVALSSPTIGLGRMYAIMLLTFYCVYGLSAVVSMIVSRENASLLSAVVCLFAATFCGYGPTITQANEWGIGFMYNISFNRWGAEAFFNEEVLPYGHIYDIAGSAKIWGYTLDRFAFDLGMMVVIGLGLRIIAFVLMLLTHRDKQR